MSTTTTAATTARNRLLGLSEARKSLATCGPEDQSVLLLADPRDLPAAQAVGLPAIQVQRINPHGLSHEEIAAVRNLGWDISVLYPHTRDGFAWGLAAAVALAELGVGVELLQWPAARPAGYSLADLHNQVGGDLASAVRHLNRLGTNSLPLRPSEGFFHPVLPCGRPLLYPKHYALGHRGTYQVIAKDGERWLDAIAERPLWVDELMEDLDSQEYAARIRTVHAKPLRVPRGMLMDSQRLKGLADFNFPVRSTGAGRVALYLEKFEGINRGGLPELRTVSRMGWRAEGFSWGTKVLDTKRDSAVVPAPGAGIHEQFFTRHRSEGEARQWASILRDLSRFHVPTILTLASLASPLLAKLGVQSAIYETVGESSSGKTSSQTIAQSVWGYGHESALPSWNATTVGLEVLLDTHRHLPLILNENQSFGRGPHAAEQQAAAAYMIGEGTGRIRSNKSLGINVVRSWQLNVLASGEHSMTSGTQFSGIVARVFPLWSPPFGDRSPKTGLVVDRIKDIVHHHYGHAGPMMVRRLLALDADGWEALKAHHREAQASLVRKARGAPQEKYAVRMAQSWGVLWVAATLLELLFPDAAPSGAYHDAILTGWSEIMNRGGERSYSERALDVARELLARHHTDFQNVGVVPEQPVGRIFPEEAGYIAFIPGPLQRALSEQGLNLATAREHWENGGILVSDKSRRGNTKTVRIGGQAVACVVIRRDAFDSVGGSEQEAEAQIVPLEDCPF